MAVFNGVFGALLADIGQIVNRFAVNAFQRCNGVGAYALMRLRVLGAQARIAIVEERRSFEPFGAVKRHHFGAAGNISSMPDIILAAAILTVVMPVPQKRSSVIALDFTSYPASSAAMRPKSPPCTPR